MHFNRSTLIRIAAPVAVALIVAGLVLGGFYFGYARGSAQTQDIIINGVSNASSTEGNVDFSLFWQAWDLLRKYHVSSTAETNQDLLYGALKGLAGSFDDPNTNFFPPSDAKKFEEDVSGSFGGIGAEISIADDQLQVSSPLKNTPAERVGLRSGDLILKINNEPTNGLDVIEAVKKIRGPVGTNVTLTLFREGWQQPRDFTITRERIMIPTLDLALHDNNTIGQIQLYSFNENAPVEFYKSAYGLLAGNTQGLILDLRNNPGGYLEVAANLAGWFVNRGEVIVSERFRSGQDREFRADGNGSFKNTPVVVLINRGSASAAEILAGTLRDLRGVKIVGERSFGKGTVQELNELKDGSTLKITVAHWVMPKGRILDKNGIKPDFEIKLSDEDIKQKRDPQLEKALEVLRAEIAQVNPNAAAAATSTPETFSGGLQGQPILLVPPSSTEQ